MFLEMAPVFKTAAILRGLFFLAPAFLLLYAVNLDHVTLVEPETGAKSTRCFYPNRLLIWNLSTQDNRDQTGTVFNIKTSLGDA